MKLVKKKVINLLTFLKDRAALMALCMIPAFGYGYFIKHNSIIFCLLISFAGYIMIDIVATGYQKYMSDEVKDKPPDARDIVHEKDQRVTEMKITDEDVGEIDPNYFDKFIQKSKSTQQLTPMDGSLVDIGNNISTNEPDYNNDIDEIYQNLGIKL